MIFYEPLPRNIWFTKSVGSKTISVRSIAKKKKKKKKREKKPKIKIKHFI